MDTQLKRFLGDVDGLGPTPTTGVLENLVKDFALDMDYWQFHIDRSGENSIALHRPEKGVQVFVVHRTDGTMSYVHSHSVWVALSALVGVETHRHYHVHQVDDQHVHATLTEERRLRGGHGDVATLTPPHDVHSHGHVRGTGEWPYTLIVLGDNFLNYQRAEFDLSNGERRVLLPGESGTPNLPDREG